MKPLTGASLLKSLLQGACGCGKQDCPIAEGSQARGGLRSVLNVEGSLDGSALAAPPRTLVLFITTSPKRGFHGAG